MKLQKINNLIKCDTVMCNQIANKKLSTNSYKGDYYFCERCFNELQKLFKRTNLKNEQKEQ